jgi:hypothetical protein
MLVVSNGIIGDRESNIAECSLNPNIHIPHIRAGRMILVLIFK